MPEIHSLTGNNILGLDDGPLFVHSDQNKNIDFATATFVCEIEVDYKSKEAVLNPPELASPEEWTPDTVYASTVIDLEDEDYPLPRTKEDWLPFLQKRQSSLMWEMDSNLSTQH